MEIHTKYCGNMNIFQIPSDKTHGRSTKIRRLKYVGYLEICGIPHIPELIYIELHGPTKIS